MLRTTGIYFIILVMILVKCFLPYNRQNEMRAV